MWQDIGIIVVAGLGITGASFLFGLLFWWITGGPREIEGVEEYDARGRLYPTPPTGSIASESQPMPPLMLGHDDANSVRQ